MLLTPEKLNALKALVSNGKLNKQALEKLAKHGKGGAPVAKKPVVIGKPVKPAPKAKTKVVPAPVVTAKPVNFKGENNYDVHGVKVKFDHSKIKPGYYIKCPDGEMRRMADDDGNGTIAFCYRAPVKSPYPKNHRA